MMLRRCRQDLYAPDPRWRSQGLPVPFGWTGPRYAALRAETRAQNLPGAGYPCGRSQRRRDWHSWAALAPYGECRARKYQRQSTEAAPGAEHRLMVRLSKALWQRRLVVARSE